MDKHDQLVRSLSTGSVGFLTFCDDVDIFVCFKGSCPTCRGARPDLSLLLLIRDLQCLPTTLPGAQCILGWVSQDTPRAARLALSGPKGRSMGTKVRDACLNWHYFPQESNTLDRSAGMFVW